MRRLRAIGAVLRAAASLDGKKARFLNLVGIVMPSVHFISAADQFEQRYYWTQEVHTGDADYAWLAYFGYGLQTSGRKASEYRARAVRRVSI